MGVRARIAPWATRYRRYKVCGGYGIVYSPDYANLCGKAADANENVDKG